MQRSTRAGSPARSGAVRAWRARIARASTGLATVGLTAALGLGASGTAHAATVGPNLVVNGDAETAVGAEWASSSGTLSRATYGVGGYPNAVIIGGGTYDGGTSLFYGGNSASMVTEQVVALDPTQLASVATGSALSRLSAFIGGYAEQQDHLGLEARWEDADGATVLTQVLDPVTNVERRNRSGFLPRADVSAIPTTAVRVVVRLTGTRINGSANDGYIDNIRLQLVAGRFPALTKSFAPTTVATNAPSRLTLTVASQDADNDDLGWTFTDDLPVGLRIATPSNASTTCTSGGAPATVNATPGGETIAVTGDVERGTSCTIGVDVVSATEGVYRNGRDNIGAIGIERPETPAQLRVLDGPPVDATITGPAPGTVVDQGAPGPVLDASCSGGLAPLTCETTVELPDGTTITVQDGDPLPTTIPGTYTITTTGTDPSGDTKTVTRTYTVTAPARGPVEPAPQVGQPGIGTIPGVGGGKLVARIGSPGTPGGSGSFVIELPGGKTVEVPARIVDGQLVADLPEGLAAGTYPVRVIYTDGAGRRVESRGTVVVPNAKCSSVPLSLVDVTRGRKGVAIKGVTSAADAGRRVAIRYLGKKGKPVVARPTVGDDGRFQVTVKDPDPRNRTPVDDRRYRAELGSKRSLSLKLTRRFTLTSVTAVAGDRWKVVGKATTPLPKRRSTVEVRVRSSCDGAWRVISTKPRLTRTGRVVVHVPAPKAGEYQVVRLVTTVLGGENRKGTKPGRTFTVPRSVG
jgi:hypothetical protein